MHYLLIFMSFIFLTVQPTDSHSSTVRNSNSLNQNLTEYLSCPLGTSKIKDQCICPVNVFLADINCICPPPSALDLDQLMCVDIVSVKQFVCGYEFSLSQPEYCIKILKKYGISRDYFTAINAKYRKQIEKIWCKDPLRDKIPKKTTFCSCTKTCGRLL